MALSGSHYTNVGSHWRLQLEWSATQDISANRSTITAKLYWIALSSYGSISSSATKTCSIYVGSDDTPGAWSDRSAGSLASLSGNQKKLIHTYIRTVDHGADGVGRVHLDAWFDAEVTLGGTYYGRINLSTGYFNLNTIPRKSTLSSSPSFTAGSDFTITISRASSSFTHKAYIYAQGTDGTYYYIKYVDFSTSQTSLSSSFTTDQKTDIFTRLAQRTSCNSKVLVITYSGGTEIGRNEYVGTLSAPAATTLTSGYDMYRYVDETTTFGLNRADSEFTHTIKVYCDGILIHTKTAVTTSYAWTPTQAEMDAMYNRMVSKTVVDGNIEITTFYNGVQVRSVTNNDMDWYVRNSNPVFSAATVNYDDSNATSKAITGDGTKIVQNVSTVKVTLPATSKAVAQNKATMTRYIATLGGQEKIATYSTADVVFDFAKIDAAVDQTLEIKAEDSRGNTTTLTRTITMIPYQPPTLNVTGKRKNGFEDDTTILSGGSISPVTIASVQKNSVKSVKFHYKKVSDATTVTTWATWTSYLAGEITKSGTTFTCTAKVITMDYSTAWNFEVIVEDQFGSKTTPILVSAGKPIMFVDSVKKSVGIGKFPSGTNGLEVDGNITVSNGQINGLNTIGTANPNNSGATVSINWKDDMPRIRYGGGGVGSANGFQIVGLGDAVKFAVDDYGVITVGGYNSIRIPANANLDDYTTPGYYYSPANADASTMLNLPASSAFSLFVEKHAGTKQTFTTYVNNDAHRTYIRNKYSSTWGVWLEVITLAATGSNANGWFMRYSNGTQICHVNGTASLAINNAYGSLFQNSVRWTYPATFSAEPAVAVSELRWGTSASWGTIADKTTTYADLRGIDAFNRAAGTTSFSAIAIGRWK